MINAYHLQITPFGAVGFSFVCRLGDLAMPSGSIEFAEVHLNCQIVNSPTGLRRRNLEALLFLATVLAGRLHGSRTTATPAVQSFS